MAIYFPAPPDGRALKFLFLGVAAASQMRWSALSQNTILIPEKLGNCVLPPCLYHVQRSDWTIVGELKIVRSCSRGTIMQGLQGQGNWKLGCFSLQCFGQAGTGSVAYSYTHGTLKLELKSSNCSIPRTHSLAFPSYKWTRQGKIRYSLCRNKLFPLNNKFTNDGRVCADHCQK